MSKALALVIEDDPGSLEGLAELVKGEGFETLTATSLEAGRRALLASHPDVVLSDLVLPDGDGLELLAELPSSPATELIYVTGNATVGTAVEALRRGAYDYLTKPIDVARLKTLLAQCKRTQELKREVLNLRGELRRLGRFGSLVGTSEPMQRLYDLIEKVAPTSATVFLAGESGTGKELVAETIHRLSRRRNETFLGLNCGAVAANLIESELFGHEKGSFTGAERQHRGYFERCHAGTLFLDEITEMSTELQVKLLRVLETGRILRVGGDRELTVDVRVIAATNRDADKAVADGKLRKDLFYRLKVFPIELPPLSARGDDIPLLAQHFLDVLNHRERASKRLTRAAVEALQANPWPGNIRELRNTLERAYILAEDEIGPNCLPAVEERPVAATSKGPQLTVEVGSTLSAVEKSLIFATLEHVKGDKRAAADALGVSLKTIYNRLKEYRDVGDGGPDEGSGGGDAEVTPDDGDEPGERSSEA